MKWVKPFYCPEKVNMESRTVPRPEAYSEPCQTSKIKCFVKIVNG